MLLQGMESRVFQQFSRLSRRTQGALEGLTKEELEEILTFANRAASVTCSRSGAIPAMPTLEELAQ